MKPDEILKYCLENLEGSVLVESWGEKGIFYNPGHVLKRPGAGGIVEMDYDFSAVLLYACVVENIMRRMERLRGPCLSMLIILLWMGCILGSLRICSRNIWNHFRNGSKGLKMLGRHFRSFFRGMLFPFGRESVCGSD